MGGRVVASRIDVTLFDQGEDRCTNSIVMLRSER